jgi:hypothetical protein
MKMDFILSDCCYRNLGDCLQPQNNGNQETAANFSRGAFKVNENQSHSDESDGKEFLNYCNNNNYQNYYEHSKTKQNLYKENNGEERGNFNELDEILNHVPRLPSRLQGIGGEKMNFIMVATTLDETTIVEKLQSTLDETASHALPLSFNVQSMQHIYEGKQGSIYNCMMVCMCILFSC